jgi:hypothetical protein
MPITTVGQLHETNVILDMFQPCGTIDIDLIRTLVSTKQDTLLYESHKSIVSPQSSQLEDTEYPGRTGILECFHKE